MAGTISPAPKHQFFDNVGDPANGYKLFTYDAGTTTKRATYTDSALSVANANPIVLDSAGRATIFLASASYKFVFALPTDSDPPTSPLWTVDNVGAVPVIATDLDIEGTSGEAISVGQVVYLSDGSGGQTAGRWYKADADLIYASIDADSIGIVTSTFGQTGTALGIRLEGRVTGLSALTAGSVYWISATAGELTSTAPTNARPVGVADSTTSLILTSRVTATESIEGAKTFIDAAQFNAAPTYRPGTATVYSGTVLGRLEKNITAVGNVGAGEDTLMSRSVEANTLGANGDSLRVIAHGTFAANGNSKRLKFKFGATSVTVWDAVINNENWEIVVTIYRLTATTQLMFLKSQRSTTFFVLNRSAPAETLTGAVTVQLTGEATTDNDIRQEAMTIDVIG